MFLKNKILRDNVFSLKLKQTKCWFKNRKFREIYFVFDSRNINIFYLLSTKMKENREVWVKNDEIPLKFSLFSVRFFSFVTNKIETLIRDDWEKLRKTRETRKRKRNAPLIKQEPVWDGFASKPDQVTTEPVERLDRFYQQHGS